MSWGSLGEDAGSVRIIHERPPVAGRGRAEYGMTRRPSDHRLRIVACPEPDCDAVAEVVDRHILDSTGGRVSMVRTRCLGRHIRDCVDAAA